MRPAISAHPRIAHLPALDGLRGLAVIGVVLFHAEGWLRGGYLGVDLFFVLSGFLITSILLAEHALRGRIDLRVFWVRRARRLLPALFALMLVIAVYALVLAKPSEQNGLRGDALATLAYWANWHALLAHKTYWELFTARSPLEHMWSLAIEEQFYVVWPLLVFAVLVLLRRGTRALLLLTLSLLAGSVLAMALRSSGSSTDGLTRAYLGTDTRAAAILAGAALAMVMGPSPRLGPGARRWLDPLGALALLGLGIAWARLRGQDPFLYHGGFWLAELACLVLIACAAAPGSRVARVLGWWPFRFAGSISYGVYLWHWPVFCVLTPQRVHSGGGALLVLRLLATVAVSLASYRWIEQPIRSGRLRLRRPLLLVPTAFAFAALVVVLCTRIRTVEGAPQAPAVQGRAAELVPHPDLFQVIVLGDSTANSLGWCLRGLQDPSLSVHLLGVDGCTMLGDNCNGPQWSEYALTVRPNATLVLLGGAFMHGQHLDGVWRTACFAPLDSVFQSTLQTRLGELGSPAGDIWVVTIPYPLGDWDSAESRAEVDCINASLRAAAKAVPNVKILDLAERLCPQGACDQEFGGVTIRPDGVHYSLDGAAGLSRWVMSEIRQ